MSTAAMLAFAAAAAGTAGAWELLAAAEGTRASADVQNAWSSIRQRLTSIDTSGN